MEMEGELAFQLARNMAVRKAGLWAVDLAFQVAEGKDARTVQEWDRMTAAEKDTQSVVSMETKRVL